MISIEFKCKIKQREYQREWMKKRRLAWIDANGPCKKCGSRENLEIDHIDPATKVYNPAALWSRKESVRAEELSKCQVLCNKCHLEKTFRFSKRHGLHGYKNLKCRCDICRKAKSDALKRARALRPRRI